MPKEKIAILAPVAGKIVKIKEIGKEDRYFDYNLSGVQGHVYIDELYRTVFCCDTDLEAHGVKSSIKKIYFTDVVFEAVN